MKVNSRAINISVYACGQAELVSNKTEYSSLDTPSTKVVPCEGSNTLLDMEALSSACRKKLSCVVRLVLFFMDYSNQFAFRARER